MKVVNWTISHLLDVLRGWACRSLSRRETELRFAADSPLEEGGFEPSVSMAEARDVGAVERWGNRKALDSKLLGRIRGLSMCDTVRLRVCRRFPMRRQQSRHPTEPPEIEIDDRGRIERQNL